MEIAAHSDAPNSPVAPFFSSTPTDLERLRAALLQKPGNGDGTGGHGWDDENAQGVENDVHLVPASVMFPIVLRDEETRVLLTRRTDHLRDHPGQICFPGGRSDPGDVSAADTAIREMWEETGVTADRIEVIGYLPDRWTITGFQITPVVAIVRPPFDLRPDAFEVADIFEAPLAFLLDLANHRVTPMPGTTRSLVSIPYGERCIWGATAGMIHVLAKRLASDFSK
ncbi:MAG: CoA pyrophosphatase [Candidatus Accumulibacter sp.]|jgi:8-oxo-dGTP pyrophosphatase MutT (NUDIX family)|nr:CoA pyrophosphatase [Accumulibacter sp.]